MVLTFCYNIPGKGRFDKKDIESRLEVIYKPLLTLELTRLQKTETAKAKKEGRKEQKLKIKNIPPPYCILRDLENKRMCVTFIRITGGIGKEDRKNSRKVR